MPDAPADALPDLARPRVSIRSTLLPVTGFIAAGLSLLTVAHLMPPLWARSSRPASEMAVAVASVGLTTLGAIFLPIWARDVRVVAIHLLAGAVFIAVAGEVQGAQSVETFHAAASWLVGFGLISTIWVATAKWPHIRQWIWWIALLWAIGQPAATFLRSESGMGQESASTIPHRDFNDILRGSDSAFAR